MRILHMSDFHGILPVNDYLGTIPNVSEYDLIVFSGDLCTNSFGSLNKTHEAMYQLEWMRSNIHKFKTMIKKVPFLFIPGNHDFLSPEKIEEELIAAGVEAINLTDKVVTVRGVTFAGFPYIPAIGGCWNFEREIPEMKLEVERLVSTLNQNSVDVLVTHAPLHGCLDLTYDGKHIGNSMNLEYLLEEDKMPKVICHGHCHEASGVAVRNGILVSNAARMYHIIEV